MFNHKRLLSGLSDFSIKGMLAAFCAMLLAAPPPALATTGALWVQGTQIYFVSKKGNNTDGRSWETAFNELNQIRWLQMYGAGPVIIYVDGGTQSMTYNTALNVPPYLVPLPQGAGGTAPEPLPGPSSITITKMTQVNIFAPPVGGNGLSQHSGQIIIDGRGQLDHGISIMRRNVTINGLAFHGIKVTGFTNYGVQALFEPTSLIGIDIDGAMVRSGSSSHLPPAGLYASNDPSGNALTVRGLVVHNTANGMYLVGGLLSNITYSWIYNDEYAAVPLGSGTDNTSPYFPSSVGVRFAGPFYGVGTSAGGTVTMPSSQVSYCVLGPGLDDGFVSGRAAWVTLSNNLFLNAHLANVAESLSPIVDPPAPPNGIHLLPAVQSVRLNNITSFMTRLNSQRQVHDCIFAPLSYGQLGVNSSVVFGGSVVLPPGRVGTGNIQDRTTGNIAALSDKETDPHFLDKAIYEYGAEVSENTLINTNYAVAQYAVATYPPTLVLPVIRTGSALTSVKQLLDTRLSGPIAE